MFDYLRNCSSNPHQVCCEDSPTIGITFFLSDDLAPHSRSQLCVELDRCLTCTVILIAMYLRQCLSIYSIQTWHDSRLMCGITARAHVDDLDLDARSQWVSKDKKSAFNYLNN